MRSAHLLHCAILCYTNVLITSNNNKNNNVSHQSSSQQTSQRDASFQGSSQLDGIGNCPRVYRDVFLATSPSHYSVYQLFIVVIFYRLQEDRSLLWQWTPVVPLSLNMLYLMLPYSAVSQLHTCMFVLSDSISLLLHALHLHLFF